MYADENVIKIKHAVLREVAKLAFEGTLDAQRDHIPTPPAIAKNVPPLRTPKNIMASTSINSTQNIFMSSLSFIYIFFSYILDVRISVQYKL